MTMWVRLHGNRDRPFNVRVAHKLLVLLQVVWWGVFSKRYEDEIAAQAEVFGGPGGAGRLKALRLRVTEHNVLVVAKYYSRITLARLAELLDLPVEEARPDSQNLEP